MNPLFEKAKPEIGSRERSPARSINKAPTLSRKIAARISRHIRPDRRSSIIVRAPARRAARESGSRERQSAVNIRRALSRFSRTGKSPEEDVASDKRAAAFACPRAKSDRARPEEPSVFYRRLSAAIGVKSRRHLREPRTLTCTRGGVVLVFAESGVT